MTWRKWMVRGLVFGTLAVCAGIGLLYQRWTNPSAVREQVVGKLQAMYPGAIVTVDSARLRILGGIVLNDLRMCRRDDPDKTEFLHVPSAILYHDKEKVLDGQMIIRKVELNRPHLRIARQRDGAWNLQGILGPGQPEVQLPTIVVHKGTFVIEPSEGSSQPPVEVGELDVSFINDPIETVIISAQSKSKVTGNLTAKGTFDRTHKELRLALATRGVAVNHTALQHVSLPSKLAGVKFDAMLDIDADLGCRLSEGTPPEYSVRARLTKGSLEHPQLPLPFSDVRASIECTGGVVRVSNFEARGGAALVKGRAWGVLPNVDQHFNVDVELTNVQISSELASRLPEKIRKLQHSFQAVGTSKVRVTCARRDGKWISPSTGGHSRIVLQPEGMQICFVKFPYTLRKTSGVLDWDLQGQSIHVDITAYARTRPVLLRGVWNGEELGATATFDIQASDVTVEKELLDALPPKLQKLAHSFHPTATIDVKSHLRRYPGSPEFLGEYHIALRDGKICWDEFAYPLENASGFLDVYPKHWEFREGKAGFQGAEVSVQARSKPLADTSKPARPDEIQVVIEARNLALDHHLHEALVTMPQLYKAWDTFQPEGRMNFVANIEKAPGKEQDLDIELDVRGCSMLPHFFPYLLKEMNGNLRFNKGRLEVTKVRAQHGKTELSLENASVDIKPGGAYFADLKNLRVKNLHADVELIQALPKPLRSCIDSLELKEPVDIGTRLIVAQAADPAAAPEIWWDGQLAMQKAQLSTGIPWSKVTGTFACTGRHNGRQLQGLNGNFLLEDAVLFKQPFKKINGKFHVKENTPEVLNVGLHAPIFNGDITGQVRLELTSSLRYELNMTASQIDLKQFGQHNLGPSSQLNGMAVARLHLNGMGSNTDTLDGNGSIDVPNGRLYNLPLLLDLLKFLGLRWPDRTAFEELHALFSIHGDRVTVRRLELTGNAVSLSGKGDFKLDGTDLNLDFSPTWARVEQLLPAVVRPMPSAFSKQLLTIEMRGKVTANANDLKFNKKLVPLLTDPLLYVRDRVFGPQNDQRP